MRIRIITVIVLIATFFVGCKDEKSVDNLEVVKPVVIENFFKVSITFIAKKDDDFSLFYTEDGSTDFKIAPIWKGIKGQETEQTLVYNLPEEVYPTQLRLDFGLKKDQEDIVFKSILMEYKGNKKEIKGQELGMYFTPDLSKCTFDPLTGVIKAVFKDGERQYPSLYPHAKPLGDEISKLAK